MKPAEHVRANVTDDGMVLLDIVRGEIFTANVIAARVWSRVVVENVPQPEVVASIAEDYGAAPDMVLRDVEEFIASARTRGLICD